MIEMSSVWYQPSTDKIIVYTPYLLWPSGYTSHMVCYNDDWSVIHGKEILTGYGFVRIGDFE